MDTKFINEYFYSLPEPLHIIAFGVIVAMYSHLFLGFWKIKDRIKRHVVVYFLIRFAILMFYVFSKAQDETYGMFDIFLPIYIISYIDGLIVLKGHSFHRCNNLKAATKKLTDFQSKKSNGSRKEIPKKK